MQAHSWSSNEKNDPYKLPHCLPTTKDRIKEYGPYLDQLRGRISAAKAPATQGPTSVATDLGAALMQLRDLHAAGVLSAEEYERAKAKILA